MYLQRYFEQSTLAATVLAMFTSAMLHRQTRSSATAEIARDDGRYAVRGHSRLLNVGTSRKPVCGFLVVNNTNFRPIWQHIRLSCDTAFNSISVFVT